MKSNKINRLKISSIFATVALAICLIVAFALVSNFAFATDGESESNEQINATTHQIRFTTQGIDSGADVSYKLTDSGTWVSDYKLGDRLEVEDGASVDYICTLGATNNRIIVKDSNHNYLFLIDTPLGYDFQKCSTSVETVNKDINFVMSYTSNPNPYTLNLKIQNISGEPLKGAKVKFFSLNTDTAYTGITGDDGEYTFTNLTSTQAIGSVFAEFDGYANSVKFIDAKYYNKNHLYKTSIKLPNIDSASILASTKSAHHKTFEYEVITNNDAVGAHNDLKVQNESLCINDRLSPPCEWVVGMDGSLDYTVTSSPTTKKTIIRPICEPGYSLVKWKLNRGNNAEEYYEPGQSFILGEEEILDVEPVYDNGVEPGPEPEPAPTPGEKVDATAQTGDSTAALPLAILAIAAGAVVFVARRKASKTF